MATHFNVAGNYYLSTKKKRIINRCYCTLLLAAQVVGLSVFCFRTIAKKTIIIIITSSKNLLESLGTTKAGGMNGK